MITYKDFKVGDKVKIENPGQLFSAYAQMAIMMGATRWYSGNYSEDYRLLKGRTGVIVKMKEHHIQSDTVCFLLDIGDCEIVIGATGVISLDEVKIKKQVKAFPIVAFMKGM